MLAVASISVTALGRLGKLVNGVPMGLHVGTRVAFWSQVVLILGVIAAGQIRRAAPMMIEACVMLAVA